MGTSNPNTGGVIGGGDFGYTATRANTTTITTTTTATRNSIIKRSMLGQVVSGVVNLTANLNCSGDGIIVGGPNTVINMNGFSITGPGQDRL